MKIYDMYNGFNEISCDNIKNINSNTGFYWILCYVNELDYIKDKFNLYDNNIKDCQDFDKETKIEFLDNYTFLIFNILDYYNSSVHSRELYIFLNKHFIITSFKEDLDMIESFIGDININRNCYMLKKEPYPDIVLYYILDRIIVKNYKVISQLESETDKVEIKILKRPSHSQLNDLIILRRQVYKIRIFLNPLRYIGDSLLSNDNFMIDGKCMAYFKNLNNKIDKLMMSLESLVDDLALVREAFESEISNKTNELMKTFTIIATIFLPLNFITSMYGMNLKGMPFVRLDNGYYYVVGIMLLICLWLIWKFKKKKWF